MTGEWAPGSFYTVIDIKRDKSAENDILRANYTKTEALKAKIVLLKFD